MKRSLKVKGQNFEMDRIDVTKIAFDSTFWGPPGLRIVTGPVLSLLSTSTSWRRFSFSSSHFILGLLRHCYGAHCLACFSLGLDLSGWIPSFCFSLSFSLLFCLLAS